MTPIYKRSLLECQNAACGWRGTMHQEIAQTVTPSLQPNPEVKLPVERRIRELLQAQLQLEPG